MQNRLLRYLFLLLALTWAGVIYYISSQPVTEIPVLFPHQDKLFHAIVFAILGFLGMGALEAASHGYHAWQAWLIAVMVSAYGILDEFHQRFVPGRTADGLDVLADIGGGLLGIWVMYSLVKVFSRQNHPVL